MPQQGPIIVIGQFPHVGTQSPTSNGYHYSNLGGTYMSGSAGGDTSGSDQAMQNELRVYAESVAEAKPTPCVTAAPPGISLSTINAHAKYAATTILQGPNAAYESSVIIYQASDGSIEKTLPFTSYNPNAAGVDTASLPDGAKLIALVHNHPDRNSPTDTYPSYGDKTVLPLLRVDSQKPGVLWTVHDQALLYIADANTGKTYVYDNVNYNSDAPSCDL